MSASHPIVMIVDDDPNSHFFAKRALSKGAGVNTFIQTWNGLEAIEWLQAFGTSGHRNVTHVLLDLAMPVMDGFEFLDAFSALPDSCTKDIRVVLVSSSPNAEDHRKALSHGCVQAVFEKALMPSDCPAILGSSEYSGNFV